MSTYLITAPEALTTASQDLTRIGSSLTAAQSAAAPSTTAVVAAAGDEVSAAIASLFSGHGQGFQALGAQAARLHSQFVQALDGAQFEAPQGLVTIDGDTQHTSLWPRIARIDAQRQFKIIYAARAAVRPVPYLVDHALDPEALALP